MREAVFNLFKDRWVLTSAQTICGGGTLHVAPVRIIQHGDRDSLLRVLGEILAEKVPIVPEPDWNGSQATVDPMVEALGLKSWRAFVSHARSFNLEERPEGFLLEEWPRKGDAFSADACWQKRFPRDGLPKVVDYLIRRVKPQGRWQEGTSTKSISRKHAGAETEAKSTAVQFGYKLGWFAVRSSDPQKVAAGLKLDETREASWEEGIGAAYEQNAIFITPPVKGWILVAGNWAMGAGDRPGVRSIERIVTRLSRMFGEAQAFATHRVVEYHHWMRAAKGVLHRAFAYLGESAEVLVNQGKQSAVERSIPWFKLSKEEWMPTEEDVMQIAGAWSVNPSMLGENYATTGSGLIAKPPTDGPVPVW